MCELFLFSYFNILTDLGRVGVFILIACLVAFCTIVCLLLSIFKSGYSIKKRAWLIFCYAGLVLFEWWAEKMIDEMESYTALTLSIIFLSLALLVMIPEKSIKIKKEQRQLARLLDKSLMQSVNSSEKEISSCKNILNKIEENSGVSTIRATCQDENEKTSDEIDFLNVKTILNKLEYYTISSQDKKIAKELKDSIFFAEKNGLDENLKQKINEGLGALLKIMSKYAI